jgi:Na+-transporting NADH:ubiquinone oxidoreductase subunit C
VRRSNLYVILFSAILTIVLGGLLAVTSVGLGPIQQKSVELDTKKQILEAVMEVKEGADILALYDKVIKSEVINLKGEVVTTDADGKTLVAEKVDISRQYKKKPVDRLFPVFKFYGEEASAEIQSYILPVYGSGLWDNIWGFVALNIDGSEIKGAVFAHKGETPGLGARITEKGVQARFKGKELFNEEGEFVSVAMLKGENNPPSRIDSHHVDGMSGATITANGVTSMLDAYFQYYQPYFEKKEKATAAL